MKASDGLAIIVFASLDKYLGRKASGFDETTKKVTPACLKRDIPYLLAQFPKSASALFATRICRGQLVVDNSIAEVGSVVLDERRIKGGDHLTD